MEGEGVAQKQELRDFLSTFPEPIFYVSRTATNLLGLERFAPNFFFITFEDSWSGRHPANFTPRRMPVRKPRGNVGMVNWLLNNAEVSKFIAEKTPPGSTPNIVIASFDEESEAICAERGYRLLMPPYSLRSHIDSKVTTTQIGNEAGIDSAPNILTSIADYSDLVSQAGDAGLGTDLVIQMPMGDSGTTTFFVSDAASFDAVSSRICGTPIKIMRRISHLPLAVEAIVLDDHVVIGPLLREVTGHPELTPYRGGWTGSEVYPGLVSKAATEACLHIVRAFCEAVRKRGYRGILEVSILHDQQTGASYLGEVNPRISGSSAHSNLTETSGSLPLFAYHLGHFLAEGVQFSDIPSSGSTWPNIADSSQWSTLIVQETSDEERVVTSAPESGVYRFAENGKLTFVDFSIDWHNLTNAGNELYLLRLVSPGWRLSSGVEIAFLMISRRVQEDTYALTPFSHNLIEQVQALFETRSITALEKLVRRAGRRTMSAIGR